MTNNLRQQTAGSPEPELPALNLNAADGYENLSACVIIFHVNIPTEISEFFDCIASAPLIDFGSTVRSSWAVADLKVRNEQREGFLTKQHAAKKMPEQNNRPGIEHYSLIKNNSAAASLTAK